MTEAPYTRELIDELAQGLTSCLWLIPYKITYQDVGAIVAQLLLDLDKAKEALEKIAQGNSSPIGRPDISVKEWMNWPYNIVTQALEEIKTK